MKNLEPKIFRKRLTIEAKYELKIDENIIKKFLIELARHLGMTILSKPFIFSPDNSKHPLHHGLAGFIGWVESGCSIYTWDKFNFLSIEIYTCKNFNTQKAVNFSKKFFKCRSIVSKEL